MTALCFAFRLSCIGLCLIYGAAEMFFLFPFYTPRRKLRAIQIWSHRVLASCGMTLHTYGTLPAENRGQMLVCNHISWLDIMAVNAAHPGRFVAKDDVAKWPVVGYLATQARTVYVARNKGAGGGNSEKLRNVTQALKDGDTVTLFPEGTSSEGRTILPFKTGFFPAAAEAQVSLVPVLCRYPNPDGSSPNPHTAYYGDISLWQSICMVIRQPRSTAELHFLPPVAAGERQQTAALIREQLIAKQQELG